MLYQLILHENFKTKYAQFCRQLGTYVCDALISF